MTQLRKQKDAISNYFDDVLRGIGHRNSSFMDVDAVTHDGKTKRWLVQEFKHEGEPLDKAQHWMLQDLTTLPKHFTAWIVVKRQDGHIGWADFADVKATYEVITVQAYQERFAAWWAQTYIRPTRRSVPIIQAVPVAHAPATTMLTADDISW